MNNQKDVIKGQFVIVGDEVSIGKDSRIWNLVYIGSRVIIGERVTIGSQVHVGSDVIIGDDTLIEGHAYIPDLTRVGEGCFIGPNVTFTNDIYPPVRKVTGIKAWKGVIIEDGAIIGAGASILAGVKVGSRAVVAMGSTVLSNVPSDTVVAGSPAHEINQRKTYNQRQKEYAMRAARDMAPSTDEIKTSE